MFAKIKALLDLGRISNLPTIWSNCLAAWVLAGAGFSRSESMAFRELYSVIGKLANVPLVWLFALAASLLYVGGTTLNDLFDADYDRQHRPNRPIPSGIIRVPLGWGIGIGSLVVGCGIFVYMGFSCGDIPLIVLSLALVGVIVLYNWLHKKSVWAAVPMAGCRLLLYIIVGLVAVNVSYIFVLEAKKFSEMTVSDVSTQTMTAQQVGGVLAFGSALFLYVLVLTLCARAESGSESLNVSRKMSLLLYSPVLASVGVLALQKAEAIQCLVALVAATVFIVWTHLTIRHLFDSSQGDARIGAAVARFLAGICLIDAMAAASASSNWWPALACFGLFVLALLLQRVVPST